MLELLNLSPRQRDLAPGEWLLAAQIL